MKNLLLTILFLVAFSCKKNSEIETSQSIVIIDSAGLKVETIEKKPENLNLISFLENPIELQKFKQKKENYVTTGVIKGQKYYYKPNIQNSIFYAYNFTENLSSNYRLNMITVFKYGENKHKYDDETEIMIAFEIYNQDPDLGDADLIGASKKELELKFGIDYQTFDNRIIYSNKNKVLLLELEKEGVVSLHYIKLNTEKIDMALIKEIVENQ
uniref:hypothetical protein n=1 Tax=Flavobacterium sp. TaxID=239 RepID=UPI004049A8C6